MRVKDRRHDRAPTFFIIRSLLSGENTSPDHGALLGSEDRATTLGETGGDEVAQTLRLGYLLSFFIAIFLVAVTAQLRARKVHPPLFWTVIVATSTAGTTLSDFLDRSAGLGYLKGSLLILTGLVVTFLVWKRSGETFAVEKIKTVRGESFYWTAILLSNTLGTAFGDFLSVPRVSSGDTSSLREGRPASLGGRFTGSGRGGLGCPRPGLGMAPT